MGCCAVSKCLYVDEFIHNSMEMSDIFDFTLGAIVCMPWEL